MERVPECGRREKDLQGECEVWVVMGLTWMERGRRIGVSLNEEKDVSVLPYSIV